MVPAVPAVSALVGAQVRPAQNRMPVASAEGVARHRLREPSAAPQAWGLGALTVEDMIFLQQYEPYP
jgi:hypothetical protein